MVAVILAIFGCAPLADESLTKRLNLPPTVESSRGCFNLAAGTVPVVVSGNVDGSIVVWNAESGKLLAAVQLDKGPVRVAIASDGTRVFAANEDKIAVVVDVTNKRIDGQLTLKSNAFDVAISRDGKIGVIGYSNGEILCYDLDRLEIIWSAKHLGSFVAVAVNETGTRIATGASDGSIAVRDAKTGGVIASYSAHRTPVVALLWTETGEQESVISAGGHDGTIAVYNWEMRRIVRRFKTDSYLQCISASAAEHVLAAGSAELGKLQSTRRRAEVTVWDLKSGELLHKLATDGVQVKAITILENRVVYSPVGKLESIRIRLTGGP